MRTTPKSLRLTIAILGRTNVGKSSLLNYIAGQDVAIVAPVPGTTTDVVEKPMELLPLGPALFLDTAGVDDNSALGAKRMARTDKAFARADVALLLLEPNQLGPIEEQLLAYARARKLPVIVVVGKCDLQAPAAAWLERIRQTTLQVLTVSTINAAGRGVEREAFQAALIQALTAVCPDDWLEPPPLV